jgi:hypothetical protein
LNSQISSFYTPALGGGQSLRSAYRPVSKGLRRLDRAANGAPKQLAEKSRVAVPAATVRTRACSKNRTGKSATRLERELEGGLHEPGRSGVDHLTEERAASVAVDRRWSKELGVIKSVEGFQTEFQRS